MNKFVNIYGRECDFYCPYCEDKGFFVCCLSGGECYCTCSAGKDLQEYEAKLTQWGKQQEVSNQKETPCQHNWVMDGHNAGEPICSKCYKYDRELL
jgi:hypothetical protein